MESDAAIDVVLRRTELERDLARLLDGGVPKGWQSLRFEGLATGTVMECLLHVDRNGVTQPSDSSDDAFDLLAELRKVMYRPGYGTWFSLEMRLDDQGHAETHYNFDEEADWSFPLDDESYVEDQQRYPRDPEHIPTWLAPKLGLGGASN